MTIFSFFLFFEKNWTQNDSFTAEWNIAFINIALSLEIPPLLHFFPSMCSGMIDAYILRTPERQTTRFVRSVTSKNKKSTRKKNTTKQQTAIIRTQHVCSFNFLRFFPLLWGYTRTCASISCSRSMRFDFTPCLMLVFIHYYFFCFGLRFAFCVLCFEVVWEMFTSARDDCDYRMTAQLRACRLNALIFYAIFCLSKLWKFLFLFIFLLFLFVCGFCVGNMVFVLGKTYYLCNNCFWLRKYLE